MDGNIIYEHRRIPFCYIRAEYGIYHHLECRGGVGKAKEHDCGFEQSFWCKEGSLPFIAGFDLNVVVSLSDVELGEQCAPC